MSRLLLGPCRLVPLVIGAAFCAPVGAQGHASQDRQPCDCSESRAPEGSGEADHPAVAQLSRTYELARVSADLAASRAECERLRLENLKLKLQKQKASLSDAAAKLRPAVGDAARAFGEEANVVRRAVWSTSTIPVHWENPTEENREEREWVRSAIARTWERHSALTFTDWDQAEERSDGIRIRIADDHPHCKGLGTRIDGMTDGMVLNFTFGSWCPACLDDRRGAIEKIAIHEFGHALGFAHEQNRQDAPAWCQLERQGTDGDWRITVYDPDSIMNYCNSRWNNDGRLSPLDIEAVQMLYGRPPDGIAPQGASERRLQSALAGRE